MPELAGELQLGAELEFYLLGADGLPVDRANYYSDLDGTGADVVLRGGVDPRGPIGADHGGALRGRPRPVRDRHRPAPSPRLRRRGRAHERRVAARRGHAGLSVTFMARPLPGEPGSGLHVQQASPDLLGADGKLTDVGRSFVAGQLADASGLCALAAGTINSYRRLHAGPEAPGAVVWGHVNRAALIRIGAGPRSARPASSTAAPIRPPTRTCSLPGSSPTGAGRHRRGARAGAAERGVDRGFRPVGESQRFAPLSAHARRRARRLHPRRRARRRVRRPVGSGVGRRSPRRVGGVPVARHDVGTRLVSRRLTVAAAGRAPRPRVVARTRRAASAR